MSTRMGSFPFGPYPCDIIARKYSRLSSTHNPFNAKAANVDIMKLLTHLPILGFLRTFISSCLQRMA
jgi:hypothetical protein